MIEHDDDDTELLDDDASIDDKLDAITSQAIEDERASRAECTENPDIDPVFAAKRVGIKIEEHKVGEVVDQAEAALAAIGAVYVRARSLVRVVRDRSGRDFLLRPEGAPAIVPLTIERLTELLAGAAKWYVPTSNNGWIARRPPEWIARTLAARDAWKRLPVIDGVTDSPVLRPDGSVLDWPGYDEATRLIYDPGPTVFPPVPEAPSRDDARKALDDLTDVFDEFPFVSTSDVAAIAALVLSLVARPAIDGCTPMFVTRAPAPGSGKGILIDAAATIATGRAAPKMAPTDSDDEMRKRLFALALESPAIVSIDNVEGELGSASLAMALTSGEIQDRVLGQSITRTAPIRFVMTATGNNLAFRGDLGRRIVPIDLDSKHENPEDRTFKRGDLLAHVRRERPRLVVAALTLLSAYSNAGRPAHGLSVKGSYEAWDRLVRGAIMWAGEVDPLGGVQRIRESGDVDRDNLRSLLVAWREKLGDRPVLVAEALARLADQLAPYADRTGRMDAKLAGYALRKLKGRPAGGLMLANGARAAGGITWRVVTA